RVEGVPDRRTRETVDDTQTQLGGGAAGEDHLLSGALPHAFWLAIAPHVLGQDRLVAFVDRVTYGLANEVIGDREQLQAMLVEQRRAFLGVTRLVDNTAHVEVVTPTGELESVVAHLSSQGRQL